MRLSLTPEWAKKIGLNNALVLESFVDSRNNPYCEVDIDGGIVFDATVWHDRLFPFITPSAFSKCIDSLVEYGYITVNEGKVLVGDSVVGLPKKRKPKSKESKLDTSERPTSAVMRMNLAVREAVGAAQTVNFGRYIPLAKSLLTMNVSEDDIRGWYVDRDGYWYTEHWLGKKGQPPTEKMIRDTVGIILQQQGAKEEPNTWSPL